MKSAFFFYKKIRPKLLSSLQENKTKSEVRSSDTTGIANLSVTILSIVGYRTSCGHMTNFRMHETDMSAIEYWSSGLIALGIYI